MVLVVKRHFQQYFIYIIAEEIKYPENTIDIIFLLWTLWNEYWYSV